MDCKLIRRQGVFLFECRSCFQTYVTYDEFLAHTHWDLIKTEDLPENQAYFNPITGQKEYKCNICNKVFKTKGYLNRHKDHMRHTIKTEFVTETVPVQDEKYTCDLCSSEFKTKGNLKKHRTRHFPPQEQCPHCEKRFHEEYTLKQHVFSVHRQQKDFSCPHCSYAASNKHTLRLHVIRKHTKNYPLMCDICGKGYTKKYILDVHRKSVHEGVHFVCEDCGKVFKYMAGLTNHRRILHEKTAKKKERKMCPVCGIKFLHLNSHMKVHEGEKNVECELCPKRFWKKGELRIHVLRKHQSERPHKCDFCGQCFILKQELKVHVKRRHTGEKQIENEAERPFACEICGKRFKMQAPLVDHLRKHAGEKAYSCDICQEKFVSKYYLRLHKCSS